MQRPPVQGTPLQQSALTVQIWPKSAHEPPPASGTVPASPPPPPASPGGAPPHGPQTPWALPRAATQEVPGQQSALFVHWPHAETHEVALHT